MSSSDSSSKLRRREKAYNPRLKDRGRKSGEQATGSALAAQMAMANIKDLNRLRDRGHDVDSVVLAKISQSLDTAPPDTPTQQRRQAAAQMSAGKKSRGPLLAGLTGAGVCLLAIGAFFLFGSSRYSVSGTMRSEKKPLAGVELQFHAATGSLLPVKVTTSAEGGFSVSGLPAGVYRITVQPDGAEAVQVPQVYKQLESTPLRLKVDRNRENETLYAMQPRRR
ncbi:MAG: carboxypeptidase-like regulatory domain-containing protein [Planctomycetia bacterium]